MYTFFSNDNKNFSYVYDGNSDLTGDNSVTIEDDGFKFKLSTIWKEFSQIQAEMFDTKHKQLHTVEDHAGK